MTSQIALVLSSLAICLSLVSLIFTAYQQYFKRPAISILLAPRVTVYYEHDGRLYLNISLSVRNKGAQYASIRGLIGSVSEKTLGTSSTFHWVAFMRSENIAKTGEAYRPIFSVDELAEILVVPARTSLAKRVQFITDEKLELKQGEYSIRVYVLEGLKKRASAEARASFSLSDEKSRTILRIDQETHLVKSSVVIPLELKL
jgi:hypothetical protein